MKFFAFYIFFTAVFIASCRDSVQKAPLDYSGEVRKKDNALLKMNNYVVRRNQELIKQFVKRTGLDMKETGSGLWVEIYEMGKGNPVKSGDIVEMSYKLQLLDGTLVDSSTVNKPKVFRVGKGGIEAGLEEGVLLLHVGDRARLIIPPHMGFGSLTF